MSTIKYLTRFNTLIRPSTVPRTLPNPPQTRNNTILQHVLHVRGFRADTTRAFTTTNSTVGKEKGGNDGIPPPPPPTNPTATQEKLVRYGKIVKERFNTSWTPKPHLSKFVPRTVSGKTKNIRVSPWKLNLVAETVRRLRVNDARKQLKFNIKRQSKTVDEQIRKLVNLADIRYDLKPEELEVERCFVTKATPLKRIKYHARGRFGKKFRRHSHLNVTVGEIDFTSKIANARNERDRDRWVKWREEARAVRERAEEERRELDMLRGLDSIEEEVEEEEEIMEENKEGKKE